MYTAPERKMKKRSDRCEICKKYTALKEPREVMPECFVYGFCFKDHHGDYGTAYPVYIPDTGCKSFVKRSGVAEVEQDVTGQMDITDFPEVMP